jgi:hypothetical protein
VREQPFFFFKEQKKCQSAREIGSKRGVEDQLVQSGSRVCLPAACTTGLGADAHGRAFSAHEGAVGHGAAQA